MLLKLVRIFLRLLLPHLLIQQPKTVNVVWRLVTAQHRSILLQQLQQLLQRVECMNADATIEASSFEHPNIVTQVKSLRQYERSCLRAACLQMYR